MSQCCSIFCPLSRQGLRLRGLTKGVVCSPQVGNSLWKTPVAGRARPARTAGWRGSGRVAAGVSGSPVEGTSGSTMLALLRGRVGEAALGPGCVRVSDTRKARGLRPSGAGPCGGILAVLESPASAVKVSRQEVSEWIGSGNPGSRVLARARDSLRTWLRPGRTWLVKPRRVLSPPRSGASASSPVDDSAVCARCGVSSGEVSATPRLGRAERASARWPGLRARDGDQAVGGRAHGSSWLQKSTSGARSRSKGHGSSPPAPAQAGRLEGEIAPEAGSRWRKSPARKQRYR